MISRRLSDESDFGHPCWKFVSKVDSTPSSNVPNFNVCYLVVLSLWLFALMDRWPGDKAVESVKIPIWEVSVWYYQGLFKEFLVLKLNHFDGALVSSSSLFLTRYTDYTGYLSYFARNKLIGYFTDKLYEYMSMFMIVSMYLFSHSRRHVYI